MRGKYILPWYKSCIYIRANKEAVCTNYLKKTALPLITVYTIYISLLFLWKEAMKVLIAFVDNNTG